MMKLKKNQFKKKSKKKNQSQPVFIFKTHDPNHEPVTILIEDKT